MRKIKKEYVIIAACLATMLLTLIIVWKPVSAAGPLYVDKNGCGGASPCYATLQAAVNVAVNGDEVRVRGEQNVPPGPGIMAKIKAKNITIKGGWTASWTQGGPKAYLNAKSGGRVIALIAGSQVRLENLTIANGFTPPLAQLDDPELTGWYGRGGGLLVADGSRVDVVGCEFSGNDSVYIGGGIAFEENGGTVVSTISNTVFNGNFAAASGGGLFNYRSSVSVVGSSFVGNWVGYSHGGGLVSNLSSAQTMTVTNNIFFGNYATYAGGVSSISGRLIMTGNRVALNRATNAQQAPPSNSSQALSLSSAEILSIPELQVEGEISAQGIYDGIGGGVHIANANFSTVIVGNLIYNNTSAVNVGGGMYVRHSPGNYSNNVIIQNTGGGLYVLGTNSPGQRFDQNTIVGNSGVGLSLIEDPGNVPPKSFFAMNNLIAHNNVGVVSDRGTAVLTATLLFNSTNTQVQNGGSLNQTGTVIADPLLRTDLVHLSSGSPAINAGVNSGVTTDIDGQTWAAPYDIGADQFNAGDTIFPPLNTIYLPLILK